jgi:tRNA(Ile)-lysidine synthase
VTELLERVRATGLLPAGADVLVLLSGGRDSVCLLDVALRLGCAVRALHVNYGLREGADGDEAHCRDLCRRLGVELAVHRAHRPEGAAGNLQAWARDVRYAQAASEAGAGTIAVAHTASDQAETILYRLAASPGRRALLGMEARSGSIVRPLLGVTREETGAWCRARGLPWRDDPTNASDEFARVRVRARLLPALEAVDPRAAANVVRTAELLRDEAAVLDDIVDSTLAGRDRTRRRSLTEDDPRARRRCPCSGRPRCAPPARPGEAMAASARRSPSALWPAKTEEPPCSAGCRSSSGR